MNHSKLLFVDARTSVPMRFFMRPSPEKAKLRPLIEHGGGILASKCFPNTIRLVEPGSRVLTTDNNTVSTKYIWDCVKENKLLDKEKYVIRHDSLDVSDISDGESSARLFVVKTTERNLKSRTEYSREDDEKIIDYIVKTKRYSDVRGITLWRNLESTGLLGNHTSQSLRERWRRQIAPKLYTFKLTENQMRSFEVEGCNVNTKVRRKSSGKKKSQQWYTKKEVEEAFVESCANKEVLTISDESDGEFEDEINLSTTDLESDKTSRETYTASEVWAMFRYIFNNFDHEDIKSDGMWEKMELSGITSHPWKSTKDYFFEQVVPNIHSYHLPKFEIERLSTVVDIPRNDDSTSCSSPDDNVGSESNNAVSSIREGQLSPGTNKSANGESIGYLDTRAIFRYILKNFVYEDITSDATWLKMEVEKVTGHGWHAMKDHFFQCMIPRIHSYRLTKLQLKRLGSVVSIPDPPENCQSTCIGSEETAATTKPDTELYDCDAYTDEDVEAVLKYIVEHMGRHELTGDTLWKNMERSSVTPRSWKSMKFYFFHRVVPDIHQHNLSKADLQRLGNFVRLPESDRDGLELENCDPYTDQNVKDMLKNILEQLDRFKPTGNLLWRNMEHSMVTPHTWTSMKFYFFHYIVPGIHSLNLSKADLRRLGEFVRLPDSPVSDIPLVADRNDNGPANASTIISKTTKENSAQDSECKDSTCTSKPATQSSPSKNSQNRAPERRSPRRSEIAAKSPNQSPIELSSTSENPSPKGPTHVADFRRSLRRSEIATEIGKKSPSKNAEKKSPTNNSETSSLDSQTPDVEESSPSLLGSKDTDSSKSRSPSQITSEVGNDQSSCAATEVDSSTRTPLRINSLRQSLVAKLWSVSPSTRSCSATSVDTLDEQLLGNLRTPILQSMKKRIQFVLTPPANSQSTSEVASVQQVGMTDAPNREDSTGVFKVPKAVVQFPRRKRNATADICATAPKSRLTNQENHVPLPGNQSPKLGNTRSTLGERNPLAAARGSPSEIEAAAGSDSPSSQHCITTNSIVLMEMAKQDVGDLIDEVGEWFASSLDSEDGVHITKDKIQEYYEKLEHLNEYMNRALLSARVERIMDKSPNYMSFEDKLAIYKFVTFYRS